MRISHSVYDNGHAIVLHPFKQNKQRFQAFLFLHNNPATALRLRVFIPSDSISVRNPGVLGNGQASRSANLHRESKALLGPRHNQEAEEFHLGLLWTIFGTPMHNPF